ncbi:MAG: methyltransferase [Methylibium sp. NZG]|nr:MAG: methyltransferase [Methylibium sp. NZG]
MQAPGTEDRLLAPAHAARTSFLTLLEGSLARADGAAGRFVSLVLAKYRGSEPDLNQLLVRSVILRNEPCLSLVYRHATRDITKNLPIPDGLRLIDGLLGSDFRNAHLHTTTEEVQLSISQRGQCTLRTTKLATHAQAPAAAQDHNRAKQHLVELDRPFLAALGVTDAQQRLVPAMARKWKQINKFVEVFSHALASSPLAAAREVRVMDFGAGKGYLTFAVHDHLRHALGLQAQVTGVELRSDMVALCNAAASRLGLQGLHFEQGDVGSVAPAAFDVMIALHACDTATDHAIHKGIRAGAAIILCSPCCHKQLRPQLLSPHPLRPILQHGVHLGQEAEMLTDGLRALLLESRGYQTQVFEFVSLEHTQKNKMILAVKRAHPTAPDEVLAQIDEIKRFYGIREQCLESLLAREA